MTKPQRTAALALALLAVLLLLERLGPSERARGHHKAARVLADGASIDRIAAHLLVSSAAGDAWTVEQLRRAAERASARGAPETAAALLQRALAEPPVGEDPSAEGNPSVEVVSLANCNAAGGEGGAR